MSEIKRPELRATDDRGNVRPADARYLSTRDLRKQKAYVKKVGESQQLEKGDAAEDGSNG